MEAGLAAVWTAGGCEGSEASEFASDGSAGGVDLPTMVSLKCGLASYGNTIQHNLRTNSPPFPVIATVMPAMRLKRDGDDAPDSSFWIFLSSFFLA